MKRAILIILDSAGVGNAVDAKDFGDFGANTIGHIAEQADNFKIDNMRKLGLGNIEGVTAIDSLDNTTGIYGRLQELSKGKDTTIGHWEIAGLEIDTPFPTYPDGFPEEIIDKFTQEIGVGILANKPASGTAVIEEYFDEHMATKKPIVYTSGDSVFQIATHEDLYSPEELYKLCETARKILVGKHAVARVIARPFIGKKGNLQRTANRRDFSISPFEDTMLDNIKNANMRVKAVGKIEDIFNKQGITDAVHTESNSDGVDKTIEYMKEDFEGLIFTNLVDFDAKFGHRRNVKGYQNALEEFDARLPEIYEHLKEDDLLIISADHGNDPTYTGTDHTREMVPVLIYKKGITSFNFGTKHGFFSIAKTICDYLEVKDTGRGENLLED